MFVSSFCELHLNYLQLFTSGLVAQLFFFLPRVDHIFSLGQGSRYSSGFLTAPKFMLQSKFSDFSVLLEVDSYVKIQMQHCFQVIESLSSDLCSYLPFAVPEKLLLKP